MVTDVLERVEALLPDIRERAAVTESDRRISEETIESLVGTGLFRMFVTRAQGGDEAEPERFFAVVQELAAACGSTGWSASLIGTAAWHVSLLDPDAATDVWGQDPDALVTCSYAPAGRLVPQGSGYRLSGEWRSAPGVEHCAWVMLGSLLLGHNGDPIDYTAVLVPRADLEVSDDWSVVGLRGSGSRDVRVEDAFVPAHRTYGSAGRTRISQSQHNPDSPALYRVPYASIHSTAITAPLVGAAQGAYDYHLARAKERMRLSHGGAKGLENSFTHVAVGRGLGEIDAARLQLERNLREQYAHARRNQPIPMELRLRARRDQVRATERAVEAVDLLFKAAGGHSVRTTTPIQRSWRDVHTGAAHLVNNVEQGLAMYGRWQHGLGVDDSLILV